MSINYENKQPYYSGLYYASSSYTNNAYTLGAITFVYLAIDANFHLLADDNGTPILI